ncbi:hypothetical protein RCIA181 [Methanocella arvoryzae MRE50]|uniref:Uncharacterized protein n=1 Tax=Methanocella arvoryzae (strain DSM 22066 / NBRC 105507 / MRE50) TaxID=351160 RepID=Q0W283_METAR|nr:hypothetical protein RCIA181 [Methanocella arvoryzae MRE50]
MTYSFFCHWVFPQPVPSQRTICYISLSPLPLMALRAVVLSASNFLAIYVCSRVSDASGKGKNRRCTGLISAYICIKLPGGYPANSYLSTN